MNFGNERNAKRLVEMGLARNDGFVPPSSLCIENARILLERLEGRFEPDVFPTPGGGLTFEWGSAFFDACFETGPDGGSGWFSIVFADGTPGVSFETSLSGGGDARIVEELSKALEMYEVPRGGEESGGEAR